MKQTGRSRPNQSAANLIIHATEPTDTDARHPADGIQQPGAQVSFKNQLTLILPRALSPLWVEYLPLH